MERKADPVKVRMLGPSVGWTLDLLSDATMQAKKLSTDHAKLMNKSKLIRERGHGSAVLYFSALLVFTSAAHQTRLDCWPVLDLLRFSGYSHVTHVVAQRQHPVVTIGRVVEAGHFLLGQMT